MLIREIPIETKLFLSGEEKIGKVRRILNKYKIQDIPLLDEDRMIKAYVRAEDIIELNDEDSIGSLNLVNADPFFVSEDMHIINCLRVLIRQKMTSCAVTDDNGLFVGTVIDRDLFKQIGLEYQFSERGSILVLGFDKNKFLVSDVIRMLESEGAYPLMIFSGAGRNQGETQLTIKIQILDNQNIINNLTRFGVQILYTMDVPDYSEFLSDRYDQLIKFLDI